MPDTLLNNGSSTEVATSRSPTISAEPPLTLMDIALVGALLAAALWYLYRVFWARRGGCSGCAKGKSGCAVARGTAAADTAVPLSGPVVRSPASGRGKERP